MKSFVRLRKSAKHVDNDFNSIILDAMNEETTNDLIEIIWPLLDKGMSKDEINCLIVNVIDSWEPA
jgi:hypothetical protein